MNNPIKEYTEEELMGLTPEQFEDLRILVKNLRKNLKRITENRKEANKRMEEEIKNYELGRN